MSILLAILIAGGPLLSVLFAASLVGLRLPHAVLSTKVAGGGRYESMVHRPMPKPAAQQATISVAGISTHGVMQDLYGRTWREVLGLPLSEYRHSVTHRAYRALARKHHPDACGSNDAMQLVVRSINIITQ